MTTNLQTYSPEHLSLAVAWAKWNGQQGTTKQAERIARLLSMDSLRRMLAAHGASSFSNQPLSNPLD